ncbi:MAG: hypothetical protein GY943_16580, partial [Chloroflexi bacterium]|nr:hypothetical protein [Chloroflexota bacterium]
MTRYRGWILLCALLSLISFGVALPIVISDLQQVVPSESIGGGVLERVQRRGRLLCGINGSLPYFSRILEDGVVTGFDADYCRVVAT